MEEKNKNVNLENSPLKELQSEDSALDSTLGKELAILRKSKKITIEQIAQKTRISLNYLKNIEESHFFFIDAVYVFGFIENYCLELGDQGKLFFEENKQRIHNILKNAENNVNKNTNNEANQNKSSLKTSSNIKISSNLAADKKKLQVKEVNAPRKKSFFIILLVLFTILVAGGVFFFLQDKRKSFTIAEIKKSAPIKKKDFIFNQKKTSFKLFMSNQIVLDKEKLVLELVDIQQEKVNFLLKENQDSISNLNTVHSNFFVNGQQEQSISNTSFSLTFKIEKNNGNYIILSLENNLFQEKNINYSEIWKTNTHLQHKNYTVILSEKSKLNISVYLKSTFLPSYISYNIDGYRTARKSLNKNESLEINADELLQLDIGNYRTVMLIVNGIPIDLLEVGDENSHATSKIIRWVPNQNNNNYFDLIIESSISNPK